jgi:hypothetical protein
LSRALLLASLVLFAGCASEPSVRTGARGIERVDLAELARNAASYRGKRVAFSATVDRVEETTQGIWLHLSDGETKLPLYVRLTFGGAVRQMLGSGKMDFELEVGDRMLTPLGQTAVEVTPYLISQTRYFDQPVPLETPPAIPR